MDNMEQTKEIEEFTLETKLYKRRWLQLGLFFVYAAFNSMQWVQFTIIGNITSRYYGVSTLAVDWTSLLYHVMYVIMLLPAFYTMSRVGLRWTCLIGAIGTSIGSWIKYFSASPDRFVSVFIGQAIVASCQIFVLTGPSRLAATWFGHNEVATATSIGYFGVMTGISLFFLITPIIVKNHERLEDIGKDLSIFLLVVAVICTILTVALYFFFQDEPRLPPSKASALKKIKSSIESKESERVWATTKKILTNRTFLILWNSYGINSGFMNVVSTLLNPFFLAHFQNGEADAGQLGLIMNFPGNFGSIAFCMILDKMKNFKQLSIFIYAFTIVGEILFAVSLIIEMKWLVFVSVLVFGIFTISYATISFELSAEITYPEAEEISSGILLVAQQVYGTILVLIVGSLLRTYGDKTAHGFLVVILILGLMLTIFAKNKLRRENAAKDHVQKKTTAVLKVLESNSN